MSAALPTTWSTVLLTVLAIAIALAFVRLLRGPRLPDRVVALDLMGTAGVAILAVAAIAHGRAVLLDVAVLLALIGFVGTVAFAHYLEGRTGDG